MSAYDVFKKAKIDFDLNDLYWAMMYNKLSIKEVNDFAMSELLNGKEDDIFYELLCDDNLNEAIYQVKQYAEKTPQNLKLNEDLARRKWRYCKVYDVYYSEESTEEKLNKVAIIYDEFDFPKDMEQMIYYLPPKDGIYGSKHVLANICGFLDAESKWIKMNMDKR